jgi:hypothetical protein
MMPSNGLENPLRPTPGLSGAEVEPPCGRERSKSPLAKSRAQPRERERSRKTYLERTENPSFLIATRTYSREKSTHCKHRVIAISNRHKIHFFTERSERACTEPSERVPVACPFGHKSPITSRSPLLFANRGSAELEIVPSRCKQRATTLSNRGEIRVVARLVAPRQAHA